MQNKNESTFNLREQVGLLGSLYQHLTLLNEKNASTLSNISLSTDQFRLSYYSYKKKQKFGIKQFDKVNIRP